MFKNSPRLCITTDGLGQFKITDQDRTYRFALDRAVRIARNGETEKSLKDLRVGDYVYVAYHMWYETQHKGDCLIYPETIMAREQIQSQIK